MDWNCTSGVPLRKARNCATVLSCVSFMSITMRAMIDPNPSLQTHTSLEIRTHVQTHTILAQRGTLDERDGAGVGVGLGVFESSLFDQKYCNDPVDGLQSGAP